MKTPLTVVFAIAYALPAAADPCLDALKKNDGYRGAHPSIPAGRLACADNDVAQGRLNECAVAQFYLDNDADLKKAVEDDIYTLKGVQKQIDSHTNALVGQNISRLPNALDISSIDFCRVYAREQWNARKPEVLTLVSKDLSVGRTLTDSVDPIAKPQPVPFVLSYQQDHDAHTSATGLYGTVKYSFDHSVAPSFHAWDVSLAVDSTTSQPDSKSSVVAGLDYTALTGSDESPDLIQVLSWKISPQYQTDRDLRRSAFELTGSVTPKSVQLGRMGDYTYSNGGPTENNAFRFFWQPSLGIDIGRVEDAGGNAQLATVKKDGTYVRLVPSVSAEVVPYIISPNLTLSLSYRHRFDLTQGWDRGYAEFSTLYRLSKNAYLTAIYRYGRKDVTFDPINTILFGIGFTQ